MKFTLTRSQTAPCPPLHKYVSHTKAAMAMSPLQLTWEKVVWSSVERWNVWTSLQQVLFDHIDCVLTQTPPSERDKMWWTAQLGIMHFQSHLKDFYGVASFLTSTHLTNHYVKQAWRQKQHYHNNPQCSTLPTLNEVVIWRVRRWVRRWLSFFVFPVMCSGSFLPFHPRQHTVPWDTLSPSLCLSCPPCVSGETPAIFSVSWPTSQNVRARQAWAAACRKAVYDLWRQGHEDPSPVSWTRKTLHLLFGNLPIFLLEATTSRKVQQCLMAWGRYKAVSVNWRVCC